MDVTYFPPSCVRKLQGRGIKAGAPSRCTTAPLPWGGCSVSTVRVLVLPLLGVALLTAGCGLLLPTAPTTPVPEPVPECRADEYLFVGRGTFSDLGLRGHTVAPLPDPERPAMIWVTEDRMMCFQYDDGSGGTDWPIDETWMPPARNLNGEATGPPMQLIGVLAVALAVVLLSALAFRKAK